MTPDEYLQALRRKLTGFSRADRAALIEEVGSHIESGENDPRLGRSLSERRKKLMSEMGSPGRLAQGFRMIYQPDGLLDFLLVAVPLLLNTKLNLLLISLMPRYPWADVRLVVLLRLLLIGIGMWRGSKLLMLAWTGRTAVQVVAMLTLTHGYFLHQGIIWFPVLLGLICLLSWVVWQNRHDALVAVYAFLPLVVGGLGIAIDLVPTVWPTSNLDFARLQVFARHIDPLMLQVFSRFSNPLDILNYAALAVIFLARNRDLRWTGLAIYALILGCWETQSREILFTWVILPSVMVLFGWCLDLVKWRRMRLVP